MALDVLVLTAFAADEFPTDELSPWLDREWPATRPLPGAIEDYGSPVYHDGTVGVVATGVGPTAAATTVTTLFGSELVDDSTLFLTAGIAGGPPELPVGSVVLGEVIVDWDRKHRTDDGVQLLEYRPRDYVYELDDRLRSRVRMAADSVTLEAGTVTSGTVVTGGEFWHGAERAAEVTWLCEQYGAPPYRATVTEDAGTAHALARHDALDRYATIRAISNHDRESGGVRSWEDGLEVAVENAHCVASAAVERLRDD
ncbi:phosphorylase family protein [Halapricum hydrolyticum]|uniref:Phosphorylase n=1 Tax=Halapricum hydrolyticum TaxID=2979991 RepID=A0AAE3ICK0_9EURY|nr:phosphorylase [Halapricum hydrolyticum]MCU4718565.1 phosphorylase [Halapricum hydrolyticum]MCU4727586.1 phosphorylase [Halapricum hydrolyticum]